MNKYITKRELAKEFEFEYDYGLITKNDVLSIIDIVLTVEDWNAKTITRQVDIDENDIFGKSIKDICIFLQGLEKKYGEGTLEEKWSGYEENYFVFEYNDLETDDEIYGRLRNKLNEAVKDFIKKNNSRKSKMRQIAELEKQLSELKKDFK